MTTYSDIENHQIHRKIESYQSSITGVSKVNIESIRRRSRLVSLFKYLETNLKKSDTQFIPDKLLDSVYAQLEEMLSHLANFESDGQVSHLDNAISNLSTAVRNFPTPYTARYASLNKHHLERFNNEVDEIVSNFLGRLESTEDKAKEVQDLVTSTHSQIKELNKTSGVHLENLSNTFQESQNQRRDQFRNEIQSMEERIAKLIEEKTQTFDAKIQEINEKSKELVSASNTQRSESQTKIDELLKGYKKDKENFVSKIKSDISEIIDMRNHVRLLYQLTGNDATVGGYQSQAEIERKSADFYRIVAIILMISAAIALIGPYLWELYTSQTHDFQWAIFLERLPLSTIILIPALYSARESGKHRSEERHLRTLQLQISTLEPFISTLADTKKKQIREQLVDKYFDGRRIEKPTDKEKNMLEKIMDELKKLNGN